MIYLFCNQRFGRPFIEKAMAHPFDENLVLVFSTRSRAVGVVRRKIRELRHRSKFRQRSLLVDNVNTDEFRSRIRSGDHGIIMGFNQIFREETIGRFDSLVNFHPSILPFYRGPVPSYWCLENGETRTGFTLHRVTPAVDAGEILFQEEVEIAAGDTDEALDLKIANRAAGVFDRYRRHLVTGEAWEVVQVDADETYRNKVDYLSFPS